MELQLASVVMKAVQAQRESVQDCMPCSGKLGDDRNQEKIQVGRTADRLALPVR